MKPKTSLKQRVRPIIQTVGWYKGLAESDSRIERWLSLCLLGLLAFISILGMFQILNPYPLKDWFYLKITLNSMGYTGVLSYIMMVAILPLFSPLTLIIVTGAAAFGPVKGFLFSYIGCILNANIAYFLVKVLSIEDRWGNGRRSVQVKKAIQQHGYIIVMSLQLTTIIPFTLINAAAAGSGIPWKDFMKATSIGLCPCILLYSVMGTRLVSDMVSPRVYFAGVFVIIFILVVIALRKKNAQRAAA